MEEVFNITLLELLVILLVFVLSRVVAEPWILATRNIYFSSTGQSPKSAIHTTIYAFVVTIVVIAIFISIDLFGLIPGGTKNFLYKV